MINTFNDLRHWQETYNPLFSPTPYKDVMPAFHTGSDIPTPSVIQSIPDRFYLFRDIQGLQNKVTPPTENRIISLWRLLMDELEQRLRSKGEEVSIILSRNKAGNPLTAHYTMHGLRVSGLTAFAEAGVPIEILSKLVAGHASILMTIYYLKFTAAHVTDVLTEARLKVETLAARDFGLHLKSKGIEDAAKIAVANENYTIECISNGDISTDLFFDTGLGVCPFAGTRCSDGMLDTSSRKYPVPGGAKNCLHCRHFITGEPWLIPLALNQQKLAAKVQSLTQKHNGQSDRLKTLEIKRAATIGDKGINAVTPSMKRQIALLEHEIERHGVDLDFLLNTMHRGHRLIEKIKLLQSFPIEAGVPLLVADDRHELNWDREGTRFEAIDAVLQASRIYPVLCDDDFERERLSFIDTIMYNNGMKPLSMMCLSEAQKIKAADAGSEWLIRKFGALQAELLFNNAQSLKDLGFEGAEFSANIEQAVITKLPFGQSDDVENRKLAINT